MNIAELSKTYIAGADITARSIVKFGADQDHVIAASAATDAVIGVTCDLDVKSGERVDVQHGDGIVLVPAGAAITVGALLTSDASAKAVTATAGNSVIGIALQGAAGADELIEVLLMPGLAGGSLLAVGAQDTVTAAAADGAIAVKSGTVKITKAGVAVLTLANPATPGDDGKRLTIVSLTANAHTVSNAAGAGFNGGGAGTDVGTFGGAVGDGMELEAIGGKWYVLRNTNVTLG